MSAPNPYEPPGAEEAPRQPALAEHRPTRGLSGWLTALLALKVLSSFVASYASYANLRMLRSVQDSAVGAAAIQESELVVGAVAMQEAVLFLAVAVLTCVWMHRTAANLRARGAPMRFGVHAWAWFLVPFMNVFRPYGVMKELYHAGRSDILTPGAFPTWWGAWIAANLLSQIEARLSWDDPSTQDLAMAAQVGVVSGLGAAVAGIAYALVVRAVQSVQEP